MENKHAIRLIGVTISFWMFLLSITNAAEPVTDGPTTPTWTFPHAFLAPEGKGGELGWPEVVSVARPGAYWWWPGSAVTKSDITWNLETYRQAGWGNMGVIGIYGVQGEEQRFIEVFTPRWFQMFNHAVAEGQRLGMNIDLTPSSGWRLGGPHVPPEYGEETFRIEEGNISVKPNGARVKRAGPGGAGLAINPYSHAAVDFHFAWLADRFQAGNGVAPRAFYYDSFENPGNWCPEFREFFAARRGYSLDKHARELGGSGDPQQVRRVLCDYRQTLSELLLERVSEIVKWSHQRGSKLRMQAHGAPANLLDMYALAEIPETEVFGASNFDIPGYRRDPSLVTKDQTSDLVNRFASSAAHVAGRNVVISESFTWLRNHFHTALAHCKAESDRLLLNGINCIYYHGLCFAPEQTNWPGWLFYASTQANARNSIFRDIPLLNAYITRCQSVLQEGQPDNDILLYWPVFDLWMAEDRPDRRFSVHHPEWIEDTVCGAAARWMIDRGYTFDFVSDRQISNLAFKGTELIASGGNSYRTILVPAAQHIPIATLLKLIDLSKAGATVLIWKRLPQDVPGWLDSEQRRELLLHLHGMLEFDDDGVASVGSGQMVVGEDLAKLLHIAGIAREPMVDQKLQFIRRRTPERITYFIVNHTASVVDDWISLPIKFRSAVLLDPMTGRSGVAPTRHASQEQQVLLQLQPGETRVLRLYPVKQINGTDWPIIRQMRPDTVVAGTWHIEMIEGGPSIPASFATGELRSWTECDDEEARRFAGAARYSITLQKPEVAADGFMLDLGDVRESARVWLNGEPVGAVVAQPFQVDLGKQLRPGPNKLVIEVTNLSANRIRDLDLRGVNWKKFHDINFVSQLYKPFDASQWDLKPSGLLGPVTLHPYLIIDLPE